MRVTAEQRAELLSKIKIEDGQILFDAGFHGISHDALVLIHDLAADAEDMQKRIDELIPGASQESTSTNTSFRDVITALPKEMQEEIAEGTAELVAEEVVDRVAIALCESNGCRWDNIADTEAIAMSHSWEGSNVSKEDYRRDARASIAAMPQIGEPNIHRKGKEVGLSWFIGEARIDVMVEGDTMDWCVAEGGKLSGGTVMLHRSETVG